MKNRQRFYIVLGAVFVAFAVVSLAVPFVKNGAFWLAFAFAVLAIAAQLYSFPKAFENGPGVKSKFYGFPIARLTVIYLALQLALSLVFMALAAVVPAWVGLVVCVLLLCAVVVGFVSADAVRDEVERQEVAVKKDTDTMRTLQSQVANLAISCDVQDKPLLNKLAEDFRFSDPVSSPMLLDAENDLRACVEELQAAVIENRRADIPALTRKATLTLSERNRLCKLNK